MALDTIEVAREEIAKIYIAAFNRVPDSGGLQNWINQYMYAGMSYDAIAADFANQAEYKAKYPAYMTDSEYITEIYNNVFGRSPDAGGLQNWINQIANPTVSGITRGTVMREMLKSASVDGNSDGERLDNQAEFAVQSIIDGVPEATATAQLANITSDDATVTAATAAVAGEAGNALGTTFALTKGLDNVIGTENNDVIIGSVDTANNELATLSAVDIINGGAGIDTLKISSVITLADAHLPNMSNVEVMEIAASGDIGVVGAAAFDVSSIDDLTLVKVTRAADVAITAAETTNVTVSGATGDIEIEDGNAVTITDATAAKNITVNGAAGAVTVTDTKQTTGDIVIDGGTDVTVTATSTAATGDITIGATTQATGVVTLVQNLTSTGAALDNTVATTTKDISITGGSAVNVTINATNTADAVTDAGAISIGTTNVLGDGETTAVTVTQTKTNTLFTSPEVALVKGTSTVTFSAMTTGQTLSVNSLVFTAAKNLTAAEVAAAFASLTAADRQSATGVTDNGIYTVALAAGVTSAAASGATVVFTGTTAAAPTMTFGGTATAPTVTSTTTGTAASGGVDSTNSIAYGIVDVQDDATAAIETVTLNGFASANIGVSGTAADTKLDALTTLSLANNTAGGDVNVATDATELTLNVNKITSTTAVVNLDHDGNVTAGGSATVTDLTINATGSASTFELDAAALENLVINATVGLNIATGAAGYATTNLATVDVNGAGAVNLGVISASVALDSFNASGNTGGVTATIEVDSATLTGDITEYVFSEGADTVTLNAGTGTSSDVKVTLGAGNDTVDLSADNIATLGAVIDGGTGTNKIVMTAADAETATANDTFEGKITNFTKLGLGAVATTADHTVDLANMDDISYVVSANTADTAQVTTSTITITTQLDGGNTDTASITIDGTTYTTAALTASGVSTAADAIVVAAALDTVLSAAGYNVAAGGTAVLTFTAATGKKLAAISGFTITGTGVGTSAEVITSSELFLTNMANNGTLELTAAGMGATVTMDDATGDADSFNVVITKEATANVGTVTVADVETVNVTTNDEFVDANEDDLDDADAVHTLVVDADSAETVNVAGAGDISISVVSDVLALLDASTLTGKLTFTAESAVAMTIKGGSAADTIVASNEGDTINAGAGNDTVTTGDLAQITLGAGNDTIFLHAATNVNSYATILDLAAGDKFDLDSGNAGTVVFSAAGITLADTAVFQDYANAAARSFGTDGNNATWFQYSGNTYIVQSGDTTDNDFVNGTDIIVKISGLVDLGAHASYNQTIGTLEIA